MGSAAGRPTRAASPGLVCALEYPLERRCGDRRSTPRFVLRERRSGYERRSEGQRESFLVPRRVDTRLRATPWLLPALLLAVNLLSFVDILLTTQLLEAGATEVNPLLKVLLDFDVRVAALVKLSLVAGATLLIWRYRCHRKILPLALLAAAVFAAVVGYQLFLLLVA